MAPSLEKVVKSCQDDEERLQNVQQPKLNPLNCWRSLGDSPLVLSVDDLIKHLDKATYCKRTRNLDIKSSKSPRILELRCRRVISVILTLSGEKRLRARERVYLCGRALSAKASRSAPAAGRKSQNLD